MTTQFERWKETLTVDDLADIMCNENVCNDDMCAAAHECKHKMEIDDEGASWNCDECRDNFEAWGDKEVLL